MGWIAGPGGGGRTMPDFGQHQRHGGTRHLAQGIGGLVVGAAAVLLLRHWLRPASAAKAGGGAASNATRDLPPTTRGAVGGSTGGPEPAGGPARQAHPGAKQESTP